MGSRDCCFPNGRGASRGKEKQGTISATRTKSTAGGRYPRHGRGRYPLLRSGPGQLSSEPLPQLCRAAAGDRTPGCHATAHAICRPTRGQKCAGVLGPVRPTGGFRRGMSRDIVHAQRGFRRRSCGDIVRRFTGGVPFPMDWETKIQRFTGNDIRFADEIHRRWTISPPMVGTISSLRSD